MSMEKIGEINDKERGYICLIISFILIIIDELLLYLTGFLKEYHNKISNIDYGHTLLLEKYMFYGAIISALLGYTYIYGDAERDFYRWVMIPSIALFIIMDLQGIFNLLGVFIV